METLNTISFKSFESEIFGEIRFIDVEGKPYAVGNDIATALGYVRPRKAISDHCKGVLKKCYLETSGGRQELKIIPEGDIYRLIMKSRLPQAEKFEAWVMEEVLPQIRATGGYIPVKEEYSDLEILSKAFVIAQRTIANYEGVISQKDIKIKEQEDVIIEQNKLIIEQEKDLDYLDKVLAPPKLISSTDVAKDLSMTAATLHKILHVRGIIYKHDRDKCWKFYSKYQDMIPEFADYHINEYSQTLKWTEKGRRFIIDLFNTDKKTMDIIDQLSKTKRVYKNNSKTTK